MRKLLEFLVRKMHWVLFIVLEIISLVIVYTNNSYQRNVIFSSANVVVGRFSNIAGGVMSYMNLREANRQLLDRNGLLEQRVLELQDRLNNIVADTSTFKGFVPDSLPRPDYAFTVAHIVSKSVNRTSNYITVDKGRLDGIAPDMGVVSEYGIVGIVLVVSDHYSVILPVLNPKFRLSCKVNNSQYFGSLVWYGRDQRYANLEQLPRHVKFYRNDVIVTSGYSAIFPAGIIVGYVEAYQHQHDDNFFSLKVRLTTDFTRLQNVLIIKNFHQQERQNIEKEAMKNDQ
jgi:rod shape-determining protein MreC